MKKAIAAVLTVVSISVMPVAAEINFYGANGIAARQLSEIRDEIKELSVPLPAPAALQQTKMVVSVDDVTKTIDSAVCSKPVSNRAALNEALDAMAILYNRVAYSKVAAEEENDAAKALELGVYKNYLKEHIDVMLKDAYNGSYSSVEILCGKLNPGISDFSFAGTKTPPVIGSYGWRHVNLKAADGTEINVDYNVFRAGDAIMADPLWVNVKNPAFSGGEKVRVVLINSTVLTQSTQTLDLEHAGQGRFTARAGRVWIMQTEASFNQEIAVVVDGKWLTDPVSGSNNFKFRMTW